MTRFQNKTAVSNRSASRNSSTAACSDGVPDLIAETETEYIEMAIRLATDGKLRNLKRQEILQHMNNSPAFLDPASYARGIGSRLSQLVSLHT